MEEEDGDGEVDEDDDGCECLNPATRTWSLVGPAWHSAVIVTPARCRSCEVENMAGAKQTGDGWACLYTVVRQSRQVGQYVTGL